MSFADFIILHMQTKSSPVIFEHFNHVKLRKVKTHSHFWSVFGQPSVRLSPSHFVLNLWASQLPRAYDALIIMTLKLSVPLNVLTDTQLPQNTAPGQQVNAQRATNTASQQPAEQNSTSDRLLPFTQSQLSLALSIQKSRPTNITTRGMYTTHTSSRFSNLASADYCLQLRKHIKLGKPPKGEEQRYIDTVEFWRDQYSTLYLEKQRLAARVAQLELLAKQDSGRDQATPFLQEDNEPSFEEMFSNSLITPAERHLSNSSAFGQSSTLLKELEAPNSTSFFRTRVVIITDYCRFTPFKTVIDSASTHTRQQSPYRYYFIHHSVSIIVHDCYNQGDLRNYQPGNEKKQEFQRCLCLPHL
jgi:hypothetical protein